MDKDPNQPPALGTYNPKLNKKSTKIWRRYDLERTQSVTSLKTRPLTYSKLMSVGKSGHQSSKKFRSRPQTANFGSKRNLKSKSMKRLRPSTAGLAKGFNSRKNLKSARKGLKGRRAKSSKNLRMTDKDLRRPSEVFEQSQGGFNSSEYEDGEEFQPQVVKKGPHYPKYFGRFPERPILGYVKFGMKTKRLPMQFGTPNYDPLGKQFIKSLAAITPHNSRHRPIKSFNMSKAPTHDGIFDNNADHPDYSPNHEVVRRRINAGVLSMETMEARKGMEHKSHTANESYYDYDHYKSINRS